MIIKELAARIGLDVDAQSFAKGAAAVELAKAGLTKLVEVAAEMVHKFTETVQSVAETGDQVRELSQATGVGAESLQILGNAAKTEGVQLDGMAHALTILTRMMAAAKAGSKETADAFHKLGVRVDDGRGNLRNADEVFLDLAEAMSKIPDSAQKTALAMKVLGRNGAEMIKVLNIGRDEILELGRAGLILTDEQVEAGDELIKAQRKLGSVTAGIWKSAIAPLIPEITSLVKAYTEWRKANAAVTKARIREFAGAAVKAIRWLGSTVSTTFKVIGGALDVLKSQWKIVLVGMTAALAPFIVELVAAGIAATGTALGIAYAWTLAALPFIAIGAAISGVLLLLDDLEGYKQGKDSLFGRWKKVTDEWLQPKAQDPWWLRAIKNLVIWMEKALGVADDLGLVEKKTSPNANGPETGTAAGDVEVRRNNPIARLFGSQPKVTRDQYGNPNVELGWADRLFRSDVILGPALQPSAGGTTNITRNNINVVQQPGEDGEHFAQRVAAIVEERQASQNEAAAASLPATY